MAGPGDQNLITRGGRQDFSSQKPDQEPLLERDQAARDSLDTFSPGSSRPALDREPGGRKMGRSAGRRR